MGGGQVRYIQLSIGANLAKAIALTQDAHQLRLLFGTGADAGKIMVSVDNTAGRFRAARGKAGHYTATINAATADGLFALEFPAFTVAGVEAVRPVNGKPPHFVFKASADMLSVED